MDRYKLIIIGGGAAGRAAAEAAARFGTKVALVDNRSSKSPGGGNETIETKTFMNCVKEIHAFSLAREYGLTMTGNIDMGSILSQIEKRVESIKKIKKIDASIEENIDFYDSTASFKSKNEVELSTGEILFGEKIIIATGSVPTIPVIDGINEVEYNTIENIFSIKEIPKELLILGNGTTAIELAQGFIRLGSKVTVISKTNILLDEDREIADNMERYLIKSGVKFLLNSEVVKLEQKGNKKIIHVMNSGRTQIIEGDSLIIAEGRTPNVKGLGLDKIGLAIENEKVKTDEYLLTSVPNIYAIGDVKGLHSLPHKAVYEAQLVISNALFELKRSVRYDNLPSVVYTDPEIYRVGFDEDKARDGFNNISVYRFKLDSSEGFIAQGSDDPEGMIKIITDNKKRIIGAHALGKNASDYMQELAYAITFRHKIQNVTKVIHPYLSRAEALRECADISWKQKLDPEDSKGLTKFYHKLFKKR